ncbi:hypothetical protein HK101_002955 [Irineochytrium annulatum]|nr:hypothetical protein HK101_002955 [Irineochytrium annulatum]
MLATDATSLSPSPTLVDSGCYDNDTSASIALSLIRTPRLILTPFLVDTAPPSSSTSTDDASDEAALPPLPPRLLERTKARGRRRSADSSTASEDDAARDVLTDEPSADEPSATTPDAFLRSLLIVPSSTPGDNPDGECVNRMSYLSLSSSAGSPSPTTPTNPSPVLPALPTPETLRRIPRASRILFSLDAGVGEEDGDEEDDNVARDSRRKVSWPWGMFTSKKEKESKDEPTLNLPSSARLIYVISTTSPTPAHVGLVELRPCAPHNPSYPDTHQGPHLTAWVDALRCGEGYAGEALRSVMHHLFGTRVLEEEEDEEEPKGLLLAPRSPNLGGRRSRSLTRPPTYVLRYPCASTDPAPSLHRRSSPTSSPSLSVPSACHPELLTSSVLLRVLPGGGATAPAGASVHRREKITRAQRVLERLGFERIAGTAVTAGVEIVNEEAGKSVELGEREWGVMEMGRSRFIDLWVG